MICNLGVVGSIPSIGSKPEKVFRSLFLRDFEANERRRRELPLGNDRLMMRSSTKKSPKRNEKKGEYQSGQMGQTVILLVYTFGGSIPSSPTRSPKHPDRAFILKRNFQRKQAEVAQSVEHQPSKLRVAGSNLVFRSNYASVAQG